MSTFGLAFRAFFRVFKDRDFAGRLQALFAGEPAPDGEAASRLGDPRLAEPRIVDQRDAAVSLLAALQREARFLDFVMEPLDGYEDAQVGAAARDVHRDLGAVVGRIFAPEPLADEAEGSRVKVPAGFDPARYRLTGDVAGEPPFEGTLRHHGWRAAKCEMPAWTGSVESAMVVAPSEVEI